jgi:hypothetical protein
MLRFTGGDWFAGLTRAQTDESVTEHSSAAISVILCAALFVLPVIGSVRRVDDADVWWHLRVGQWVIENGTVPTHDPFSRGGAEKDWVAYSWLFEVGLYLLHQAFGLWGIVLYRTGASLCVAAAVHRLVAKRVSQILPAFLLTSVAMVTFIPLMDERPWLLTYLFSAITLDAILDPRAGRARNSIWLLPVMFALWANVHIQFVYGLALLGLGCVGVVVDGLLARSFPNRMERPASFASWWKLPLVTILCFAATLVNSYGFHLYEVVWEYATQTGAYRIILEFGPLEFREPWEWLVLALFGAAAFSLGRRSRLSSFDVLLLAGTTYLAFHTRRDVWFLVLASVTILTERLGKETGGVAPVRLTWRQTAIAFGVAAIVGLIVAFSQNLTNRRMQDAVAERYPVEAVRVIEAHAYSGPIFNHFNWGGYLIWRLPRLPVSLDGRTNLHGDAKILRCSNTWAGGPGWEDDPDLVAANVVIAEKGMVLTDLLRKDARFQLVHEDAVTYGSLVEQSMQESTFTASGSSPAQSPLRRVVPFFGLALVLALIIWQVAHLMTNPAVMPPDDFVEYWAAGRLNAAGENPYDPAKLLPLERAAGRDTDEAVMMWNPPWTLPFVMPFGLLDARVSQLLWLALNLAAVVFCADWAWRNYGGSRKRRWVSWTLALTFLPTLFVLQSGQISVVLLLGVVGFLHFERRRRYGFAGAATVLIAIKPHLAYLFWAALLLWSLDRRRWSVLLGGGLAGLAAMGIALGWNPEVVAQYREAMAHHPPEQWISPTSGAFLRLLFGGEKFWLQFLPTVIGLVWVVPHWAMNRKSWNWSEQMPLLLLASFATASYGAWPFDLVVLLLPVFHGAALVQAASDARLRRFALAAYLLIDGLILAMNLVHLGSMWFVWITPALLIGYVILTTVQSRTKAVAAVKLSAGPLGGVAHA